LLGYGILIEYLQSLTPYREPSMLDIAANAIGIGIYTLGHRLIRTGDPPAGIA
jgi:VanZ family protein